MGRRGTLRRYLKLTAVMLLGRLWHGAGRTYVRWGGLHGAYLMISHAWQAACAALGLRSDGRAYHVASVTITFVEVLFAWTLFRAPNATVAASIIGGMTERNGILVPAALLPTFGSLGPVHEKHGLAFTPGSGTQFVKMCTWVAALMPIVFFAPNTQHMMGRYAPALGYVAADRPRWLDWYPTRTWAVIGGVVGACAILAPTQHSEFIYFQF